jgi:hypothetical protein
MHSHHPTLARGRSTSKGRGRTPDSGRSSKRAAQDLGEPVIPTWGPEGEDSLSQVCVLCVVQPRARVPCV